MKLLKGLLLGSAAALAGTASARAADLPERQAAPIEYVRICDAYGAGFFYIPGTETCLKIGGLALSEVRAYDASFGMSNSIPANGVVSGLGSTVPISNASTNGGATSTGYVPTGSQYTNSRGRDDYGWNTLGRVELDTRTGTPWGTLRAFARLDAYVGSGTANSGNLSSGGAGNFNTTGASGPVRETTIVSRAFIQFAGLTAGRAQSMFDFYANAYNYQTLAGSAATTQLLAYTYTFGDGFSGTLSVEDQNFRQAFVGSTVASTVWAPGATSVSATTFGGISGTSFQGTPAGTAWPDIVGNVRVDQPWGAAQLSVAGHEARASLFASTALTSTSSATSYAFPAATTNAYGWAIQGGLQLNADYLSPGDKLWLQAAYEKGAVSYIWGNNMSFSYAAVSGNRFYGSGYNATDSSAGWNQQVMDCVFTASGVCEQQSGWSVTAAYKHYWLPTLASAVYGSYAEINYSDNALAGFGGAVGIMNIKSARVGTNLVWTPIKGFDIGAEFMYVNVSRTRPVGLAPDAVLSSVGLPSFEGTTSQYEGRVRIQRAF